MKWIVILLREKVTFMNMICSICSWTKVTSICLIRNGNLRNEATVVSGSHSKLQIIMLFNSLGLWLLLSMLHIIQHLSFFFFMNPIKMNREANSCSFRLWHLKFKFHRLLNKLNQGVEVHNCSLSEKNKIILSSSYTI